LNTARHEFMKKEIIEKYDKLNIEEYTFYPPKAVFEQLNFVTGNNVIYKQTTS